MSSSNLNWVNLPSLIEQLRYFRVKGYSLECQYVIKKPFGLYIKISEINNLSTYRNGKCKFFVSGACHADIELLKKLCFSRLCNDIPQFFGPFDSEGQAATLRCILRSVCRLH